MPHKEAQTEKQKNLFSPRSGPPPGPHLLRCGRPARRLHEEAAEEVQPRRCLFCPLLQTGVQSPISWLVAGLSGPLGLRNQHTTDRRGAQEEGRRSRSSSTTAEQRQWWQVWLWPLDLTLMRLRVVASPSGLSVGALGCFPGTGCTGPLPATCGALLDPPGSSERCTALAWQGIGHQTPTAHGPSYPPRSTIEQAASVACAVC
jgi:hypothetical protein